MMNQTSASPKTLLNESESMRRGITGVGRIIGIVQSKYLNNIVEQDHRFIKKITRPMLGFKAFHSAAATLAGIETAHMIRKGQLGQASVSAFKQFAALAA